MNIVKVRILMFCFLVGVMFTSVWRSKRPIKKIILNGRIIFRRVFDWIEYRNVRRKIRKKIKYKNIMEKLQARKK